MPGWSTEAMADLRKVFADFYPTEAESRRVVADAELRAAQIKFDAKADTNWFAILENAEKLGKLNDLIGVALRDFPEDQTLQSAEKHLSSLQINSSSAELTRVDSKQKKQEVLIGGNENPAIKYPRSDNKNDHTRRNLSAKLIVSLIS